MVNTNGVMEVAIRETLSRAKEMAMGFGWPTNIEKNPIKDTSPAIRKQVMGFINGTMGGFTGAISKMI